MAIWAWYRPGPEHRDDGDREDEAGKGEDDVEGAHRDVVRTTAGKPGDRAQRRPDDDREPDCQDPDLQRDPRAEDDPAELVAQVGVETHDVLRLVGRAAQEVDARRLATVDAGLAGVEHRHEGIVRGDDRGEDRDQHHGAEDDQAGDGRALAQDVPRACHGEGSRRFSLVGPTAASTGCRTVAISRAGSAGRGTRRTRPRPGSPRRR